MERSNGRWRDRLRTLLTRSLLDSVSRAIPGNLNNLLAPEEEDQKGQKGRVGSTKIFRFDKDKLEYKISLFDKTIPQSDFPVLFLRNGFKQTITPNRSGP